MSSIDKFYDSAIALADALQEIVDAAEADILRDDAANGRNFKESRQIKNAHAALAQFRRLAQKNRR